MLVPTMTPEEIYAEMHKDADWLWNQIVKKFHPVFQKQVKRSNSFPCAKMFLATSRDTKITYHIVFVVHNRGGWDKIPTIIIYTQ